MIPPPVVASLVTLALTGVSPFTVTVAAGSVTKAMVGCAVIVIDATAGFDIRFTDDAVIVMGFPEAMLTGAT